MRELLIIGIVGLFLMSAVGHFATGEDKSIDTTDFYVETEDQMISMDNPTVAIENGFNNTANLMVYNNATYSDIRMKMTAGPSPDGRYPSEVYLDIGNNDRYEYYFGGDGTGNWGQQYLIKDKNMNDRTQVAIVPSDQSDNIVYIKLPSKAVVSSMNISVESTGVKDFEVKLNTGVNGIDWGYSYYYSYNYGTYGYGYTRRGSSAGSYMKYGYSYYPLGSGSYSGYPYDKGYLKFDPDDSLFTLPAGKTLARVALKTPVQVYTGYGYPPGYSGYYHIMPRQYAVYQLNNWLSSSYTYSSSETHFINTQPNYLSTPVGVSQYVGNTHGTSYTTKYLYPVTDITDLFLGWKDGSINNYGMMIQMITDYDSDGRHDAYSSNYNSVDYYEMYKHGSIYSPSYGSTAYRPSVLLQYPDPAINHTVDIGGDGTLEKFYPGPFNGGEVYYLTGFQNNLNTYLTTHYPDEVDKYGNEFTYVPVQFGADSGLHITLKDINIQYDYTADVHYNPETKVALNELLSLVPGRIDDGVTYIQLNVTATGEGNITFSDLSLEGIKPNYRPTVDEIPSIELDEGVVDDEVIAISDYFHDTDEASEDLTYIVQLNDQEEHLDVFLTKKMSREGKVYLGVDASKDDNWYGTANTRISATDSGGKDIWSNLIQITILPVNDHPYLAMELPSLVEDEGMDKTELTKEYNGPQGRDLATGKLKLVISESGAPYFADVEGQDIYMDFELKGEDVELVLEDEEGFRIYQNADGTLKMTVLPPEYTDDDPYNYMIIIGSNSDFHSELGDYYLVIYASDDDTKLYDQTNISVPILINEVNDEPLIYAIPDILMDEDTTYTSRLTDGFIKTYVEDVDTPYEDMIVELISSNPSVDVTLNEEGQIHIEVESNFYGVVPVRMDVYDGDNHKNRSFNVRVRSINDIPTVTVANMYDSMIVDDLTFIRGTAADIEKQLRSVEVALAPAGQEVNEADWQEANGAYVWQFLLDIRDYAKGEYTVHIRSYDGRDYSKEEVYEIYIDTMISTYEISAPIVDITTSLSGDQSGKVLIEGTATDDIFVELVEFRVDGSIWKPATKKGDQWSILIDTNKLSNAYHNLSVRAFDGKTFSEIRSIQFKVMNVDSDLDGIPNEIEEILLMDPFNPIDGRMDFDGDGFTNVEEFEAGTDPFDPTQHPEKDTAEEIIEPMVLVFIFTAIIASILIIGLFIVNVNIDRNIQKWKEDLNLRRTERKPKTLLQKMVAIAPSFAGPIMPQDMSTALPSGRTQENMAAALPPAQEEPPQQ